MSKADRPRHRHILVAIDAAQPVSRRQFQDALKARLAAVRWDGPEPRLTRFEHPHAAIQVEHTHAAAARAALAWEAPGFRSTPLRTSGTLRALTEEAGVLLERPER